MTYEIQADSLRHLPFFRLPDPSFISDSGVCRSSDFYIQMQSFQLHQRTHFAFSPGHYSPSNDRLSPYTDYPAQKQYFVITATKEACIFASMHLAAAPTCPGISPDSLVQQGTRMRVRRFMRLRVAHLPQKPFSYSIIHQNKNRLPFFGSLCILVISRHPGSIIARCPSANPRRSSKGFFSSVTLTLNVSSASEVKSFEPQLVSRLVAIGALRLLASQGISPQFR